MIIKQYAFEPCPEKGAWALPPFKAGATVTGRFAWESDFALEEGK